MAAYGTDEGFDAWLSAKGLTLPAGAPARAVLRERGSSYVDATYAPRLDCSQPAGGFTQELAWPRSGHSVRGLRVPDDIVPIGWVNASYRAAYLEATSPGSLSATVNPNQRVRRQKAGEAEREFFEGGSTKAGYAGIAVIDAEIDGMVTPYLCHDTKSLGVWAVGT